MIKQKNNNIGGLLLATKHRKAGLMEKDGKTIEWSEREQIILILFEGDDAKAIRKYSIAPSYEEKILQGLEKIHWGCLVELELEAGEVVAVSIMEDALKNFYEKNL